jgi:UDP-glucose 4-epimerase
MNIKVLVFGSSGFLGRYLVSELLARDYKVYGADIIPVKDFEGVQFTKCDICKPDEIDAAFQGINFDFVFNLAGFANLDKAIMYPLDTMSLNVLGNMNVLGCCVKHKVGRFVFASSAYAMSNKGSFYGISKLASEKIIEEYFKRYNLPFTILRYGSVYSELPFENNYIYGLVEKAVRNKQIIHLGDGQEVREYIHASDAAKLSVDVIESSEFENLHVILTGNEKIRRYELFELIKEIMNEPINIRLEHEAESHHYKYTPYSFDPVVSRKLVANPHIDMGQGILEVIRSVHNNLDIK